MSKEVTTKIQNPTTWAEKVLAFLGLTDEGKVGAMQVQLEKMFKKQIEQRKAKINDIKRQTAEKVEELTEKLEETRDEASAAFITVDVNKIGLSDARKAYAIELNNAFDIALDEIDAQEQAIKDLNARAEATIVALEKEIARFEQKLAIIQ